MASSGNSSCDDCQKRLLDHVMLSPGAEHPHFPTFQVLSYLSPGRIASFISCHMSPQPFCGSHTAAYSSLADRLGPNLRPSNLIYPFSEHPCIFTYTAHCIFLFYLCLHWSCVCVPMRIFFPSGRHWPGLSTTFSLAWHLRTMCLVRVCGCMSEGNVTPGSRCPFPSP